jgi:hypothetical protein
VEGCRVTGRFVEKNLDWKKKNGLSAGGKKLETISCSWKLSRSFVQVHTPALGLLQGIHYVTTVYGILLHMGRGRFLLKDWYI